MEVMDSEQETVMVTMKWREKSFDIPIQLSATVLELKVLILSLTNVAPNNQKLLGLCKKVTQKYSDEDSLESIQPAVKNGMIKVTMVGTPSEEVKSFHDAMAIETVQATVFNDFSHNFSPSTLEWQRLQEFSEKTQVIFVHEPRPDKKLLVLDLDHTLLDFSRKDPITAEEMKRPFMDQFLAEVYPYYDLVIWSQTSWRWLELKVTELGMLTSDRFKICFVLDKSNMFSLDSGYVKPLHIIWSKHPRWGPHNTLAVDDLERNFVLNKSSGVLVTPFYRNPAKYLKKSSSSSSSKTPGTVASSSASGGAGAGAGAGLGPMMASAGGLGLGPGAGGGGSTHNGGVGAGGGPDPRDDCELLLLSRYLVRIAGETDLGAIDHSKWRSQF
jgi:ubiquitin-like domain-containing CTD phosphatase 1